MAHKPDEPLTMTVHNMPSFDANSVEMAAKTRRGRWTMLALLLVCIAPVIASYFTYYVIRPEGKRNYGELINPQRPIPALMVTDANGVQQPLRQWKDQWLLISVADGACDAACQQRLYWQRQLRETLGKEKERLDWVWLRTGTTLPNPETQAATAKAEVSAVAPGHEGQGQDQSTHTCGQVAVDHFDPGLGPRHRARGHGGLRGGDFGAGTQGGGAAVATGPIGTTQTRIGQPSEGAKEHQIKRDEQGDERERAQAHRYGFMTLTPEHPQQRPEGQHGSQQQQLYHRR